MPRENRLPKVFCVGLGRTGTSSLTRALGILRVRTKHYPNDRRTQSDLRSGQYRLSILERYQGVSDNPVAPFFAQFDSAFPDSKFILTVREKESWLRSVRAQYARLPEWWKQAPNARAYDEFVSACVYGTLEFSRERFAYVFDRHERAVRDYFAGREEDLLVLDVGAGNGWESLCPFLGRPVPDVPFPHANAQPRGATWSQRVATVASEIAALVATEDTFILVDDALLGRAVTAGRSFVPFLEHDGEYGGRPPGDAVAIRELERLRNAGARFILFTWPSFWWLTVYPGLRQHLDDTWRCAIRTEDLIAYETRSAP